MLSSTLAQEGPSSAGSGSGSQTGVAVADVWMDLVCLHTGAACLRAVSQTSGLETHSQAARAQAVSTRPGVEVHRKTNAGTAALVQSAQSEGGQPARIHTF